MRKLFFTLLLTPLFTFAQDDKATAILNEVSAKTAQEDCKEDCAAA
jgi:hypothetical protein